MPVSKLAEIIIDAATLRALERTTAERDCLRDALQRVLAHVRQVGGYLTPAQQATLRDAAAALAECPAPIAANGSKL